MVPAIHPTWSRDSRRILYCTDDDLRPPKKNASDVYSVAHDWPGNVRQFASAIERAIVNSREGVLSEADFAFLIVRRARKLMRCRSGR